MQDFEREWVGVHVVAWVESDPEVRILSSYIAEGRGRSVGWLVASPGSSWEGG